MPVSLCPEKDGQLNHVLLLLQGEVGCARLQREVAQERNRGGHGKSWMVWSHPNLLPEVSGLKGILSHQGGLKENICLQQTECCTQVNNMFIMEFKQICLFAERAGNIKWEE